MKWSITVRRWTLKTACVLLAFPALAPSIASAAFQVQIGYLEGLIPKAPDALTVLGPNLFGDEVNLYNGALSFTQTDLSLPGNSTLAVSLSRKYVPGRQAEVAGQFGDWDLEVPRVSGAFASNPGWVSQSGGSDRCSSFSFPPVVTRTGTTGWVPGPFNPFSPSQPAETTAGPRAQSLVPESAAGAMITAAFLATEYWQGTWLQVPGQASQEILRRSPANNLRPTGGASWPLVTRDQWQIDCLPSIRNGSGEGFMALSPEGVRYRFDWMASRSQASLIKNGLPLGRMDAYLMATEVTDRFGNWVRYTYDPASPLLLTRIESSDGRVISVVNQGGRAVSASDGTRTIQYFYTGPQLSTVHQPDGSQWRFNLSGMTPDINHVSEGATCESPGSFDQTNMSGTMTHPSGAVGTFVTRLMAHGRTNVPRHCKFVPHSNTLTYGAVWPRRVVSQTLVEKRIDGPGLTPLVWTYSFSGPHGWTTCTDCSPVKAVTVGEPDGSSTRYLYGNRFRLDEGLLLQTHVGWNGANGLRSTYRRYRSADGQVYPDQFGTSVMPHGDDTPTRNRPLDRLQVVQQGSEFVWELAPNGQGLDPFARPRTATKSSSLGYSKTETTDYYDHVGLWVLGQVASVQVAPGFVPEEHHHDPNTALRTRSLSFGLLKSQFSYHGDGTLHTWADAANPPSIFTDYFRGVPRNVSYPGGSESALVNNLGLLTSHTNAAGTTTHFSYDVMGRVSLISFPAEAQGGSHSTTISYVQVPFWDRGLAAGHWRQTISTGDNQTVRYFDGMWRERLRHQYDAVNVAGTARAVETRYNAKGEKRFESYPQNTVGNVDSYRPGQTWTHDALDRVVVHTQDSELGVLTTTTEYLNGYLKRVTNPRGHATTFTYQAFDQPAEDSIATITAPEGVRVAIARDVFGKAQSITRSGSWAGGAVQATRSYVFDTHQRLCKTIEPETGATIQAYDGAGNIAWRASGQGATGLGSCDHAAVGASAKISFGYDARNRLTSTTFGDGRPGITRSYTADGLLQHIASSSFTWTYSYNNRRLLVQEALSVPNQTPGAGWNFSYSRDGYGNTYSLTDPWGSIVYAPNALGEATQVSGYASNVTYHPNGMVAGYTLANGILRRVTQNVRGLPDEWQDIGVMHDVYRYDANGNTTSILDWQWGETRGMGYDGLDRLINANGLWGSGQYGYDGLDNLRSSRVGDRILDHHLDASNRLSSLSGSQNLSFGYDPNGNITQRGGQAYSFDIANRLRVAHGHGVYDYDGHGRRGWGVWTNGSTQLNAYTGTGAAGRLMFSNHSTKGGTRYVYLGDKLIAEHNNQTGVSYSHTDTLGSPVARTNGAGQIIGTRTRYEPYGATAAGDVPQGIGFTGHVNDTDTGLVYMQQRYYDPLAARFLSVDPVVTDAKAGSHFNRYVYAESNPYKFKDPDGRAAETPWDAANAAMGAVSLVRNLATGNYAAAAVDAVGVAADSIATVVPGLPGGAATGIQAYRAAGVAREAAVASRLAEANPGSKVQGQRMLRTSDGKKAIDPVTKEGRVVDHAVIKDGQATTYETTSMTADKGAQMAKEGRIIDAGGSYIRDKETRQLVPVAGPSTVVRER